MEPVAQRTRATGFLFPGDVIWIRESNGEVVDIRLAQIWRKPTSEGVGARLGSHAPCTHADQLCLSCSIFGSVDSSAARGEGVQDAYAGHVRFSAALVAGEAGGGPKPVRVDLTPMGTPNPGSANFYLVNRRRHSGGSINRGHRGAVGE